MGPRVASSFRCLGDFFTFSRAFQDGVWGAMERKRHLRRDRRFGSKNGEIEFGKQIVGVLIVQPDQKAPVNYSQI